MDTLLQRAGKRETKKTASKVSILVLMDTLLQQDKNILDAESSILFQSLF